MRPPQRLSSVAFVAFAALRLGPGITLLVLGVAAANVGAFLELAFLMPAALLDSQLATLERPGPDEQALILPGTDGVNAAVKRIIDWLDTDG